MLINQLLTNVYTTKWVTGFPNVWCIAQTQTGNTPNEFQYTNLLD